MMVGYFKEGIADESLELVRKLAFSDEKPDGFTLYMVLKTSMMMVSLDLAKQVHIQVADWNWGRMRSCLPL